MTPTDSDRYRARAAQRILAVLIILGTIALMLVAVTSCSSHTSDPSGPSMESWLQSLGVQPREESRPAIVPLTERDLRDARGHYRTPVHAVTGEPAATQQTIYRTPSGAEMHGPVYRLKPAPVVDHTINTEFPKLTDPLP